MLLGDGSPTRHLQLLTNQETKIKLISMQLDTLSFDEGPKELNQLNGPFWSRNYRFFRDKKPLTIIREVFNPHLESLLGYSGIKEFTKLYSSSS